MSDRTSIIAAIGAAVGTVVTIITKFLLDIYRDNSSKDLAHDDRAFLIYKDLVDKLQGQINTLEGQVSEIRLSEDVCRRESAKHIAEIQILRSEVESLRIQLQVKVNNIDFIYTNRVLVDSSDKIISSDTSILNLLGYVPDDIVGFTFKKLIVEDIKLHDNLDKVINLKVRHCNDSLINALAFISTTNLLGFEDDIVTINFLKLVI